jgi:ATP-dependent Clp protease protease subunit
LRRVARYVRIETLNGGGRLHLPRPLKFDDVTSDNEGSTTADRQKSEVPSKKETKFMNTPTPIKTPHSPVPDIVYVSFSAEISAHTTESLLAVMADCVNKKVKTVYLLLSSPGGRVMNGLNLYNVLRGMPVELITHNVGNVDSVANAIFLAGNKRYACPHSTFMFNGVGVDVKNPTRLEEKNLRESLDRLVSDHKRIGSIITDRTTLDENIVASLFTEAQTKDAAFAASTGIVHEIKDVQIPPGSRVVSLVFQR